MVGILVASLYFIDPAFSATKEDLQILFTQRHAQFNAVKFDYKIKTIYPKESVSKVKGEPPMQEVKFYFDGDKSLMQQTVNGKCVMEAGFDGTNTRIVRHGNAADDMTVAPPSDGTLSNFVSPRWFIDQALNLGPFVNLLNAKDVKLVEKGNMLQVQGSLLGGGFWVDVLLDPSKDFAIKEIKTKLGGFPSASAEVLDFQKLELPAGNLFVPKHIQIAYTNPFKEGGILFIRDIEVVNHQVVESFPNDLFIPNFRPKKNNQMLRRILRVMRLGS